LSKRCLTSASCQRGTASNQACPVRVRRGNLNTPHRMPPPLRPAVFAGLRTPHDVPAPHPLQRGVAHRYL
jgi:hypothetical protein